MGAAPGTTAADMAMSALGDRDRSGGPDAGDAEGGAPSALAVATRGHAAAVRPPAADGEWQDWPDEVWADLECLMAGSRRDAPESSRP